MAAFKLTEMVEIVVAGDRPNDWSFDGCRGTVQNVFPEGGKMYATVEIVTPLRTGEHVFAVECLKRLEEV